MAVIGQFPAANQQLANQQKAARDIQLQNLVAQARPGTGSSALSSATGAQVAEQETKQNLGMAADAIKQQDSTTALQQGAAQLGQQQTLSGLSQGNRAADIEGAQRLAAIDEQAKKEIFDSRLQFATNELGRKFTNDRQLADYARLQARSDEEWQSFVQKSELAESRKAAMMGVAFERMKQDALFSQARTRQLQEQLQTMSINDSKRKAAEDLYNKQVERDRQISAMLKEAQKKIQDDAKRRANKQGMLTAVGSVIGGVGAGIASQGDPGAIQLGMKVGGGTASVASGAGEKEYQG